MTEEKSTEELLKDAKMLIAWKKASAGGWRSEQEQALWAADYMEFAQAGIGEPAITECCNLRESLRVQVQVEEALNNEALQRCIQHRKEMNFESEELAHERCIRDFALRARLFGEKAFESDTIRKLDEQYNDLKTEIFMLQTDCMSNAYNDPQRAEILARRKLKLPEGISLTKSDADREQERKEQNLLKGVPNMYGKTQAEIEKEVRDHRARTARS
jgi:hypothetical protein